MLPVCSDTQGTIVSKEGGVIEGKNHEVTKHNKNVHQNHTQHSGDRKQRLERSVRDSQEALSLLTRVLYRETETRYGTAK